jgi:hypothetical protein
MLIYITVNDELYYLAPQQSPNISNLVSPYKDWARDATSNLRDTNISMVSVDVNKDPDVCSLVRTVYDTSMLFIAGVRSLLGQTDSSASVNAQVISLIDSGYVGWLGSTDNDFAVWTKAFNTANSTGITSIDAQHFIININNYTEIIEGDTVPVPVPSFAAAYANIEIKLEGGEYLQTSFIDGPNATDIIGTAVFFNQKDTNTFCTRSTNTCNLHRNRQGSATCDINSIWS